MLFIERGKDGKIIALHNAPSPGAMEEKSMLDEEVLSFFNSTDSWKHMMAMSDLGTVRILEDLIDILIHKNLINFTELPEHAQKRLRERKELRVKLVSQNLLVDDII
jgi:hypothetical protein